MLYVSYFWLGLGLGLVDVALTSASASCTYGLVNNPVFLSISSCLCFLLYMSLHTVCATIIFGE